MDLAEFKAEAKKLGVSEEHQQMLSNASIRERLSREQMLYINVVPRARNTGSKAEYFAERFTERRCISPPRISPHIQCRRNAEEYSPINTIDSKRVDSVVHSQWASDGKDFSSRIWGRYKVS